MGFRDSESTPASENGANANGHAAASRHENGKGGVPNDYRGPGYPGAGYGYGYGNGYGDYRGADYSSMDYRGTDPDSASENSVDIMGAMWRHRFAVLLPLLIGLGIGWAVYTTRPNVYRSSTQLLIESNRPSILDSTTGEVRGGVPSGDLLVAQLKSDHVLADAAEDPVLASVQSSMSPGAVRSMLGRQLTFQEATDSRKGGGASVFLLHVDHSTPEVATSSVRALSNALERWFADRSKSSAKELIDLITTAQDKLKPELDRLEDEYMQFRRTTELKLGESGEMINPHRERQVALQNRLDQMEQEGRALETKFETIKETWASNKDPLVVMEVISHLVGKESTNDRRIGEELDAFAKSDAEIEDLSLKRLEIERRLVPLEVKREHYLSQFAEDHPSVQAIDRELSLTRQKLNDLNLAEKTRRQELREGDDRLLELQKRQKERAASAIVSIVNAVRTQQNVLSSQMNGLKAEIADQAKEADQLAQAENDDAMHRRKIARHQKLLDQIEESMARVSLMDDKAGIVVEALSAPSSAFLIAPKPSQYLMMGGFLGAACGLGLAYLLESQAKTYRGATEISQALGVPVLAHVPHDDQKMPKVKKGETYQFAAVDPSLAVVHRPHSMASEAIRRLRTAIFFDTNANASKVIQITSPLPADGKSTVSANLAASIAKTGKRVVLVDADLRRPALSESFSLRDSDGLSELLDRGMDPTQVIYETAVENLSIIPSGDIPANPAEALSMPQFADLITWLRERYDYVILDTPPLLIVTDPAIVSEQSDGVVFAFRIRRGCRPQTKEAVAMLNGAGARLIGVVVNRSDEAASTSGYHASEAGGYHYRRYSYNGYSVQKDKKGKFSPRQKNFVISANAKPNEEKPEEEFAKIGGPDEDASRK